ncbi:hypothetical protein [Roseovarius gaetbuli]|uniref:hypothetical protein n=1 Tax=Roseovarius gaetbuli TaxID=1356575 RepID=UPI00111BDE47|nr:hypothetical protein [Roseovarius gaetbuli]
MKYLKFNIADASSFLSAPSHEVVAQKMKSEEYADSYRAFLSLAAQIADDDRHDGARALACATYGWMPTILKSFKPDRFGENNPIEKIRKISSHADAEKFVAGITEIAPINGSWVGASLNSMNMNAL